MLALGSAAIKGETLGLSLDPSWRADPDRSPVDTGAGMLSWRRVGNDGSVDQDVSSPLEEWSSIPEHTRRERVGRRVCAMRYSS